MRKRWWVSIIISIAIVSLIWFFYPKSCGGGGGIGGPLYTTECSCLGFKIVSPWNRNIMDVVMLDCYGICIERSCKTGVYYGKIDVQCQKDSDCISQCNNGCVNYNWAKENPDITECFRSWSCSCNNGVCFTDGRSPWTRK